MKRFLFAAASAVAVAIPGLASAQLYGSYYTYGSYGYYSNPGYYYEYPNQCGPMVIYTTNLPNGGYARNLPNPNMPYATGAFFYGQSYEQWSRAHDWAQRRHR